MGAFLRFLLTLLLIAALALGGYIYYAEKNAVIVVRFEEDSTSVMRIIGVKFVTYGIEEDIDFNWSRNIWITDDFLRKAEYAQRVKAYLDKGCRVIVEGEDLDYAALCTRLGIPAERWASWGTAFNGDGEAVGRGVMFFRDGEVYYQLGICFDPRIEGKMYYLDLFRTFEFDRGKMVVDSVD